MSTITKCAGFTIHNLSSREPSEGEFQTIVEDATRTGHIAGDDIRIDTCPLCKNLTMLMPDDCCYRCDPEDGPEGHPPG